MKSILIIALFATVAFSTLSNKEIHYSLAEIQKDTFGQTLLNAIQMNLYSKAPADEIIALVDQILSQLQDSQDLADGFYDQTKSTHTADVDSLTNRINDTENTISSLENSIALNQQNLESAQARLVQAQADYDSKEISINVGTADRESDHNKWVESDSELTQALEAVDEATKLIQHMLNGVTFVQVKSRFDKVFEKIKNNKSKQASLFRPLIMALSQITNKLDYQNVQKILNLLNTLRSSLADVQTNNANVEQVAAATWAEQLQELIDQKQRYYQQIQDEKVNVENLTSFIARETASLENNRLTLETLENELRNVQDAFIQATNEYNLFSAERERESIILTKLNNHLVSKFGAVQEFLQIV